MWKKVLIGLAAAGLVVIAALAGLYFYFRPDPDPDHWLDHFRDHPESSAILVIRNDSVVVAHNVRHMMPLASTVKLVVAVEYAAQAAEGRIDPDSLVALADLEKYHLPHTDGGAHAAWRTEVEPRFPNGMVPLREVAKGMIQYSSNANTEWLMERLGLYRINARLDSLGMRPHSEIYYLVSALFVARERFPHLKGDALVHALRRLPIDEYIQATYQIHRRLASDTTYKKQLGKLPLNVQRVWSDRLPASTVEVYAALMHKLNRRMFPPSVQAYLTEVVEFVMQTPGNRKWLRHAGMKGGATAFVLTKAFYATDKKGNTTEAAYFVNDLDPMQNLRLQASMNAFEKKILTDAAFRGRLQEVFRP